MLTRTKKGFTIIEVVIVLVIGAIIMLMVFLVVPALQRSQRDARRQSDARRFLAAAEQYATNNNGTYADDQAKTNTVVTSYITNSGEKFEDPSGSAYSTGNAGPTYSASKLDVATDGANPRMVYAQNSNCSGQVMATATGKNRIAVSVYQENGGRFCVNN